MVLHCEDLNSCPNGNCVGCNNSRLWCVDPRCTPSCKGCAGNIPIEPITPVQTQPFDIGKPPDSSIATWKIIVAVIVFLVVAILFGLMIWYLSYKYSNIPTVKEEMSNKKSSRQKPTTTEMSNIKQNIIVPRQPIKYPSPQVLSQYQQPMTLTPSASYVGGVSRTSLRPVNKVVSSKTNTDPTITGFN